MTRLCYHILQQTRLANPGFALNHKDIGWSCSSLVYFYHGLHESFALIRPPNDCHTGKITPPLFALRPEDGDRPASTFYSDRWQYLEPDSLACIFHRCFISQDERIRSLNRYSCLHQPCWEIDGVTDHGVFAPWGIADGTTKSPARRDTNAHAQFICGHLLLDFQRR